MSTIEGRPENVSEIDRPFPTDLTFRQQNNWEMPGPEYWKRLDEAIARIRENIARLSSTASESEEAPQE